VAVTEVFASRLADHDGALTVRSPPTSSWVSPTAVTPVDAFTVVVAAPEIANLPPSNVKD
jgi:hypothetical protein